MKFEIIHKSRKSNARVGRIHTEHGVINTPSFVAVGTNGTIKGIDNLTVSDIGLELMFCNTYHLLLNPGTDVVKSAGGLHSFINRDLPIITDSGGFQVFSLAYGGVNSELKSSGKKKNDGCVIKITEEGVLFRSYVDGKKVLLTPESSVEAQKDLGADIIIPFDELPPYHISRDALERSLERTHRWEVRSLEKHMSDPKNQAMYGVVHGGTDKGFRSRSCQFLSNYPFDGFAIGGSFGKTKDQMHDMLLDTIPNLPCDKPIHLLGIADTPSLSKCIPLGIDTFDSSYPTKAARHGTLLTSRGPMRIKPKSVKNIHEPIEHGCTCYTCTHYTVAYLNHLFKAREMIGLTLASIHNLHFMVRLMESVRNQILDDTI